MSPRNDLDICRDIRRVLVKHWIDLGRLSVRSTGGRAMLYGSLLRIEGARSELIPALIDTMIREIKSVQGIKLVRTHFENWTDDEGGWHPVRGVATQDTPRLRHIPSPVAPAHSIPDDDPSPL